MGRVPTIFAYFLVGGLKSACFATGPKPSNLELTEDGATGATLMERSREQPPPWTALPPGVLHADGKNWRYVEKRARLLDVALGLKETQLAALAASRQMLAQEVRSRLEAQGRTVGGELVTRLGAAVAEAHERLARVQDIYFETYSNDALPEGAAGRTFFAAWVLVSIPGQATEDVLSRLGAAPPT